MTATISVRIGNITRQVDCDGIVNSANRNLRAGSGVCGAIHAAAGPALEIASHALAPLEIGQAVATCGFELPNRIVIHTRGPKYHFDADPPHQLMSALEAALLLADSEKVVRLALPAISMGVHAYPPCEAVPILVKTASLVARQLEFVSEIRFVVVGEDLRNLFQKSIDAITLESNDPHLAPYPGIPTFLRKYSD